MSRGTTVISIAASELVVATDFGCPVTPGVIANRMKFDIDQIIGGEIGIDGAAALRAVPRRIIR
jgi:hypothetical protein